MSTLKVCEECNALVSPDEIGHRYGTTSTTDARLARSAAKALLAQDAAAVAAIPGAGASGAGFYFFAIEHGMLVRIVALELWPLFFQEQGLTSEQRAKVSGKKKR